MNTRQGTASRRRGEVFVDKHKSPMRMHASRVKVPLLAEPQLGSCASSGRAWRLRAARHSQEEAGPLGAHSHCLGARASRLPPLPRAFSKRKLRTLPVSWCVDSRCPVRFARGDVHARPLRFGFPKIQDLLAQFLRAAFGNSASFFGAACVLQLAPACGPVLATAAEREALGPRPARSISPRPTHSGPSVTSPDHYLRTHLPSPALSEPTSCAPHA